MAQADKDYEVGFSSDEMSSGASTPRLEPHTEGYPHQLYRLSTDANTGTKVYKLKPEFQRLPDQIPWTGMTCVFGCPDDQKFTSKAELKEHYMKNHSLAKCPVCPESDRGFSSVEELKEHYKDAHSGMKCVYCHRMFPSEDVLKVHYDKCNRARRKNGIKGYNCRFPRCTQRGFPHAVNLLNHIDHAHTPREEKSRKKKELND